MGLGGHLGDGEVDAGVGLHVEPDDGGAAVALRLDMLDVVDAGGEGALIEGDDALFHLG